MARHKRKSRQDSATPSWSLDSKVPSIPPVGPGSPATGSRNDHNRPQQHNDIDLQPQQQHDDHDTTVLMPATKKRKKKKSKRKSKQKSSSSLGETGGDHVDSDNDDDNNKNDNDDDTDVTPLEGTMMGKTMVLLDRKKGVVYSAEKRLEDGTRKPVGTILANGTIQMTDTIPDNPIQAMTSTKTTTDSTTTNGVEEPHFPFETDPDDHCESPMDAYQDIVPFLTAYQEQQRRQRRDGNYHVQIYDPYYCNGAVCRNLESLGFPHVYNQKEDCYQVWNTPTRYPKYDILITNPPYSGDHMERLIQHLVSPEFGGRNRPWMLLLPQWVHKKDYYLQGMAQLGIQPMYLVPHKRYVYVPPPSFRESKKSDVHKKSSPFVSMWYIWGGSEHHHWLSLAKTKIKNCDVAISKNALRDLRRKRRS